jgi:hypothetical protein
MAQHTVRIAIDGAQGTGKSTLLDQLAAHYRDRFFFIPEASRHVAPGFGVTSAETWSSLLADPVRLSEFFEAEEKWVIEREEAVADFVIDSSLWVVAAYRKYFHCGGDTRLAESREYGLILYCPITGAPELDGFRFVQGQHEVDQAYRELVSANFGGQISILPPATDRFWAAVAEIERQLASVR